MAASTFMHIASCSSSSSPSSTTSGLNLQLTTSFQRQAFWATTNADVEAHLISALPKRPPPVVYDPMRHRVLFTPKTMAPALCVTACELVGGKREHAMDIAAALHLMLAAAYTHENLPAFLGPCRPNTKAADFPPNIDVLTGDGLYPLGYQLVAESSCDPELLLRVVLEITGATGPRGMIEGQHVEFTTKLGNHGGRRCDVGWVERVCEKKEGRLYACGAACGGILGGGCEEEIEKLRRYGMCVGTMHGLLFYFNGGGRIPVKEEEEEEEEERLFSELQVAAERLRCSALSELEGLEERGEKNGLILRSLVDVCFEQGEKLSK